MSTIAKLLGVVPLALLVCGACSGSPGGPSMSGRLEEEPPHPLQSNEIMQRDQRTSTSEVKHILIAWRDLEDSYPGNMDPRGKQRSRWDAEALVKDLYQRLANGEPIEPLMAEFSEDEGSAQSGRSYAVTPDGGYIFEFKFMALRLEVREVGKVLTPFGWHIMQRVE